ncbi:MAG: hypothetical protein GEU73_00795 [Chloroflexi bacterium]|nr:hypothetical protein [Chloroflexota bacterium]
MLSTSGWRSSPPSSGCSAPSRSSSSPSPSSTDRNRTCSARSSFPSYLRRCRGSCTRGSAMGWLAGGRSRRTLPWSIAMDDTGRAVVAVNADFYRALGSCDLALMTRVWLQGPEATCVHPAWPLIEGWDAIYASWSRIFEHQPHMRAWPSDVEVTVDGQAAVVTCMENLDSSAGFVASMTQARARNAFRLTDGEWKMLHHHARPVEPRGGPARAARPRLN